MDDYPVLSSRNDVPLYTERSDVLPKSPDSISSHGSKLSTVAVIEHTVAKSEDRSEDLEPTLRRSKRGKGRPGNSHLNNGTQDGSADDHVSSCVVSDVEYRTGDFVYYEEPDFEYFTIGLIEEIKVSRREKYSVFIKCFYRTRDVPETAKQALPDRDNYQSQSNSKIYKDVFSRELFVSEVQETLPSKQLRGHCKVTYIPDLRTVLNTFKSNEEDSFYYVFAYNPETRRLSKIRAEIRVGNVYQAALPYFRHEAPAIYRFNSRRRRFHRMRALKRPHGNHENSSEVKSKSSRLVDAQPELAIDLPCKETHEVSAELNNKLPSEVAMSPLNAVCNSNDDDPHTPNKNLDQNSDSDHLKKTDALADNGVLPPKLESEKDWDKNFLNVATTDDHDGHCSRRHHCRCNHRRRHTLSDKNAVRKHKRRRRHPRNNRETLIWNPLSLQASLSGTSNNQYSDVNDDDGHLTTDESLKNYLDAVRSMVAFFGFGGAENDLASAENGLVLANLAATTQHAYDTLHQCNYSLRNALQAISCNPIVAKDTPRHWTTEQVRLFAHALRIHGKDFFAIQRNFFGGRSSSGAGGNLNRPWSSNVIAQSGGTGRVRGRGRRKNGLLLNKLTSNKSDETDSLPTLQEGSKSESGTLANDELADVESSNIAPITTESGSMSNTPVYSSNEPVKTVKQLIAFYYYWKRKGASSCNLGHGGLTAAAGNFATAVAAAATLNTDNHSHSQLSKAASASTVSGISFTTTTTTTNTTTTHSLPTVTLPDSSHSPNSQSSFNGKKRKATNRGYALTKQAWLGILESRKSAECELRRLLNLKFEICQQNSNREKNSGVHNSASTTPPPPPPLSEQSESMGAGLPESEIEENTITSSSAAPTGNEVSGVCETVDNFVSDTVTDEKDDNAVNNKTQENNTSQGNSSDNPSLSARSRRRTCRNCDNSLISLVETSSPLLRLLCMNCRTYFQKYGELKSTNETEKTNADLQQYHEGKVHNNNNIGFDEPPQLDCSSLAAEQLMNDTKSTTNRPPSSLGSPSRGERRKCSKTEYLIYSPPKAFRSEVDSYMEPCDSLSLSGSYSASASCLSFSSPSSSYFSPSNLSSVSHCDDGLGESSLDGGDGKSLANSEANSPHQSSSDYYPLPTLEQQTGPTTVSGLHSGLGADVKLPDENEEQQLLAKPSHHEEQIVTGDKSSSIPLPPIISSHNFSQCKPEQIGSSSSVVTSTVFSPDLLMMHMIQQEQQQQQQQNNNNNIYSVDKLNESSSSTTTDNSQSISMLGTTPMQQQQPQSVSAAAAAAAALSSNYQYSNLSINKQFTNSNNHQPSVNSAFLNGNKNNTNNDNNNNNNKESFNSDDIELNRILTAAVQRDPVPCFLDAHRSTWAHLVRVWDRRVQYSSTLEGGPILTNIGSCARTDLIYNGRGLAIPLTNHEFWDAERGRLYASYAETAIGPGAVIDVAAGENIKPVSNYSVPSGQADNACLNLTISTTPSVMEASQNALDLCARQLQKPSPHLHTYGGSMHTQQRSSSNSSTTPPVSSSRMIVPSSTAVGNKPGDCSASQQQHLQAVYDQALLLAAAAAASATAHSPQAQSGQLRDYYIKQAQQATLLDAHSTNVQNARHLNPTTTGNNNHNNSPASMTARLGAAAGTFYPPTLNCSSNVNLPGGMINNSNKSTCNDAAQLLSNLHSYGLPPNTTGNQMGNYSGRDSVPNPHRSTASPFHLQRQLAMMGLIPSSPGSCESAVPSANNVLEQRETEALQRLLLEKMEYLRNAASQRGLTPVEQYQLLQQRELLIAAFASEMASRRSDVNNNNNNSVSLLRQQPLQTTSSLPSSTIASLLPITGCGTGAMTSAVNSISTRPTASVQLPHSRLPQSLPYSAPTSNKFSHINPPDPHILLNEMHQSATAMSMAPSVQQQQQQQQQQHQHHHQQQQQSSRDNHNNSLNNFNPSSNYLSMYSDHHHHQQQQQLQQQQSSNISRSAQLSGCPTPNSTQLSAPSRATNRGGSGTNAPSNPPMDLQEQVFNATKMAMMAASMQSDQNKAFTFANLAVAAFAEMAANHQDRAFPASTRPNLSMPPPSASSSVGGNGSGGSLQDNLAQRMAHQSPIHPQLNRLSSPVNFGLRSSMSSSFTSNTPDNNNNNTNNSNLMMSNFMNQNAHKNMVGARQVRPNPSPTPTTPQHSQHQIISPLPPHMDNRLLSGVPTTTGGGNSMGRPQPPPSAPNVPVPTPAQLAQLAQLSGLSFQDQTVFNAFALAAAATATSLVAGNNAQQQQPDPFVDSVDGAPDRYRLSSQATVPHRQQQTLANAFGLPHNFANHLPSPHR